MEIKLQPIATVKNSRIAPIDDHWESIVAEIELADYIPTEGFENISDFSHLEIICYFDKARPRGNLNFPLVGILGQRKKTDPTKLDFVPLNFWNITEEH